ncbi:MAG: prepilin-type N-terminal cleavage/methylation domain-containing protein [Planctomycetota bacterium]
MKTSSRGFTLVELIVGVTVMIGVLSAAYFSVTAGYRTREAVEQHGDMLQRGRTAIDLLVRDLRHASPTSEDLVFVGLDRKREEVEADNLDFATHHWTPTHPGQGDLCEVSFFVDADPEEPGVLHLYRRRDPSPDLEPYAGGSRELIARDIAGFRLEYYDGFEWVNGWGGEDDEESLPPEPIEPEIDPDTGEPMDGPAVDPYLPGQSGLPEAVRITIGFRDRNGKTATAPGPRTGEAGEEPDLEAEAMDGVIVVQTVVRLTLIHRKRALEGGGMMGPFGDPDGSGIQPIDGGSFEGMNQ